QVVGAGIALVGVVQPVVVDRHPGGHVGGPADPEGLVVVAQLVPRHGDVGGVFAAVDVAVVDVGERVVVDPDVIGGVHLDAVVIEVLVVRVIRGDRRVANGEV